MAMTGLVAYRRGEGNQRRRKDEWHSDRLHVARTHNPGRLCPDGPVVMPPSIPRAIDAERRTAVDGWPASFSRVHDEMKSPRSSSDRWAEPPF